MGNLKADVGMLIKSLVEIVSNNIDVLVIQETKWDATFQEGQFLILGFKKPFRRDRDKHGGGY